MNDWKNYVTVALNEKFDEVLMDRADKCSFSAKYAKLWSCSPKEPYTCLLTQVLNMTLKWHVHNYFQPCPKSNPQNEMCLVSAKDKIWHPDKCTIWWFLNQAVAQQKYLTYTKHWQKNVIKFISKHCEKALCLQTRDWMLKTWHTRFLSLSVWVLRM